MSDDEPALDADDRKLVDAAVENMRKMHDRHCRECEDIRLHELSRCWQIIRTLQARVWDRLDAPDVKREEWARLTATHDALGKAAKAIME